MCAITRWVLGPKKSRMISSYLILVVARDRAINDKASFDGEDTMHAAPSPLSVERTEQCYTTLLIGLLIFVLSACSSILFSVQSIWLTATLVISSIIVVAETIDKRIQHRKRNQNSHKTL